MSNVYAHFFKTEEITFKSAKGMRDITEGEFHPFHEIFLFLGGDAEFIAEKRRYPLRPNTLILIPKYTFHQFVVNGKESDYIRCVWNFSDVPRLRPLIEAKLSKMQIAPAGEDALRICTRMKEAVRQPHTPCEVELLSESCLTLLLMAIQPADEAETVEDCRQFSPVTCAALNRINRAVRESLTIAALAQELHVSVSHLNHSFKKDLQLPIHKYILDKRLIEANRLISTGIAPTRAAEQCGFGDYSGFYRQYIKMFHTTPSGKAVKSGANRFAKSVRRKD